MAEDQTTYSNFLTIIISNIVDILVTGILITVDYSDRYYAVESLVKARIFRLLLLAVLWLSVLLPLLLLGLELLVLTDVVVLMGRVMEFGGDFSGSHYGSKSIVKILKCQVGGSLMRLDLRSDVRIGRLAFQNIASNKC